MVDVILIIFSAVCMITGLIGCIIPMLPGLPIAYVGLLLLHATDKVQYTTTQLLVWLLIVGVLLVLDYFTPMLGSKYGGGSCDRGIVGRSRISSGNKIGYRLVNRFPVWNNLETDCMRIFLLSVYCWGIPYVEFLRHYL